MYFDKDELTAMAWALDRFDAQDAVQGGVSASALSSALDKVRAELTVSPTVDRAMERFNARLAETKIEAAIEERNPEKLKAAIDDARRCRRCGMFRAALIHTGNHPDNCHAFEG